MRASTRSQTGFTMIELLTVIAIMVILAAILLPVLGRVREQSRRTECMANLHQIATAIKLFKLDEREYPPDLSERPIPGTERWFGPVDAQGRPAKSAPGYGLATLYPDYIQSLRTFNCPNNETDSLAAEGGQNPPVTQAEAQSATGISYNSYDGWDLALGQLRYDRLWRPTALGALDRHYRRQLYWRYPPEDTVVTWCIFHRDVDPNDPAPVLSTKDRDIVLHLDGTARLVPSNDSVPELGCGHLTLPGDVD
ncbi:MAG: DUF1559 domain-containing protein [Armatimonadetes bacterium]|jgi:prepilin-type N-terminal cleavage/methylation domain-containing protein|nr:DUF1559 domain-containing protein [Armatimonadota bacterium]